MPFVTPTTDIDPACLAGQLQLDNDASLTAKDADLPPGNRRPSAAQHQQHTKSTGKERYGRQLS